MLQLETFIPLGPSVADKPDIDRLEDLIHAARLMEKLAILAEESSRDRFSEWIPAYKAKCLKKARLRRKGLLRLRAMIVKETDRIREAYS